MDWETKALCEGTSVDLFFNDDNHAEAIRVCERCPVRAECLESQLRWEWERGYFDMLGILSGRSGRRLMYGVTGGMTPEQRWQFVMGADGLDRRLGELYGNEEIDAVLVLDRAREIWENNQ